MERLLGLCVLAFSVSAFAQQGQMDRQQDEEVNRPQQHELGEADTQQEAPASMRGQTQGADQQQMRSQQQRQQTQGQQSQGQQPQTQARSQQQGQALQQLASEHDDLSTFVKALQSTGLADAVARGEYTAFAPTNDAFKQMDKSVEEMLKPENQEQLVALLRNHLVADRVDAEQAKKLDQALTVGGGTLQLAQSDGKLTVNGAEVKEADIRAGSLTVHSIDQVLEPGQGAGQPSVAGQQRGQQQDRMGDQQPQGTSDEAVAGEKEEPQD